MKRYFSHGIKILSEMDFPEFTTTNSLKTDVTIQFDEIDPPLS